MKTIARGKLGRVLAIALVLAALSWPAVSWSDPLSYLAGLSGGSGLYSESGDAGDSIATAQDAGGLPGTISGALDDSGSDSIDMFKITPGSSLTASDDTPFSGVFLFLFDSAGNIIAGADSLISSLEASSLSGDYFLAVALSDRWPVDAAGSPLVDPDFAVLGGVLASWSTGYPATVPEPTTLALIAGLIGLGAAAWRGHRS